MKKIVIIIVTIVIMLSVVIIVVCNNKTIDDSNIDDTVIEEEIIPPAEIEEKIRQHSQSIGMLVEVQDDDEQYLCIVFDMAGEAFAKLFPSVSFMISGTVSFQNKTNIYYLYQYYKDRLCNELYELREVVDYLLIVQYALSDSEVMTQFLEEEAIIKEQETQKKENNVVSWEALMDNLQMVDKEHLDAFHSYFSKIATKYTQDNEKLRSNLDKLTQQIEECKKKWSLWQKFENRFIKFVY